MKKIIILFLFVLSGCATTNHYLTFEGLPSKNIYTFYSNGIPITSFSDDSTLILLSEQEDYLYGKPYMRLWLLYSNNSDTPFLLEPYNFIKLVGKYKQEILTYFPQSPTDILNDVDERKSVSLIDKSVGSALRALSTDKTIINSSEAKGLKSQEDIGSKNNDLFITANWYNIYENSFNNGILRKNTVFPHHSVNGYIYFPLPKINGSKDYNSDQSPDIQDVEFKVYFNKNDKEQSIDLTPTKIW